MFHRVVSLLLAGVLLINSTLALAADAPELLARSSGSVNINRGGAENPVIEVARSTLWGALAGLTVGSAIALASDGGGGEPVRWGIVIGTFVGLGAGIYFVANRPQPSGGLLEVRDGRLVPNATFSAVEAAPGGVRLRVITAAF